MKTVCVPLAPGFEEIEAVTIIDVLRRAGVRVVVAGTEPGPIRGSHDITITPDTILERVDADTLDMIALPGGMPGSLHLRDDAAVRALVAHVAARGGYTTAICAAPIVLAALHHQFFAVRGEIVTVYILYERLRRDIFVLDLQGDELYLESRRWFGFSPEEVLVVHRKLPIPPCR